MPSIWVFLHSLLWSRKCMWEGAEIKVQIQNVISTIFLPSAQHLDASDDENGCTLHMQMGLGRWKPVGMGWCALPVFKNNTHLGFYLNFVWNVDEIHFHLLWFMKCCRSREVEDSRCDYMCVRVCCQAGLWWLWWSTWKMDHWTHFWGWVTIPD